MNQARDILTEKDLTLVLVKGESVLESGRRGIIPLVEAVKDDWKGADAADAAVGKAAAYLYCILEAKSLYAKLLSRQAAEILEEAGISYEYGTMTEYIQNRDKTGPCPMEKAVEDAESPEQALDIIRRKTEEMKVLSR